MRKRGIWEWICITGILWCPIITAGCIALKYVWCVIRGRECVIYYDDLRPLLAVSVLACLTIFLKNMLWLDTPRKIHLCTWMNSLDYESLRITERKYNAMYPQINEEYLSDMPDGLVLGRKGKQFVRVLLEKGNILNAIIMGAPGTGKSSLLLTTLLYQYHLSPDKEDTTVFALDIKPELAKKSVVIKGNDRVKVMDPNDRETYGWDVYYRLSSNATDDEILAELDIIAHAFIDACEAKENEFFYKSARNIFNGVMLWCYINGRSFIQSVNYLVDSSLSDTIEKILKDTEGKVRYRTVRRLLSPYAGKKGEAIDDIGMTLNEGLDILSQQNFQFFFDLNPRKASPMDLEKKISIFFAIHENKLKQYKYLLRLITMQIMDHCSQRPEDSHMITLIIDEAFRLGAINWIDFMSTSRSRQVSTILAFQSISQMQSVWGKEDTKSLVELCRIISVLSCTDPDTANMISSWAGEYQEVRYSTNDKGGTTKSYESRKVLTPSDLMMLQDNNEAVLFIKGEYLRVSVARARYFKVVELNKVSTKCRRMNEKEK